MDGKTDLPMLTANHGTSLRRVGLIRRNEGRIVTLWLKWVYVTWFASLS